MKKLLQSLPFVVLAALAVVPFTSGTEAEPQQASVQLAENACGKCGDGRCVASCGETSLSCPADCGVSSSY